MEWKAKPYFNENSYFKRCGKLNFLKMRCLVFFKSLKLKFLTKLRRILEFHSSCSRVYCMVCQFTWNTWYRHHIYTCITWVLVFRSSTKWHTLKVMKENKLDILFIPVRSNGFNMKNRYASTKLLKEKYLHATIISDFFTKHPIASEQFMQT